jgi:hypothetical protein
MLYASPYLVKLLVDVRTWKSGFEQQGSNLPLCSFLKNKTTFCIPMKSLKPVEGELWVVEEEKWWTEMETAVNDLNPDVVDVVAELPMLGKLLLKRFWKESDYEAYRIVTAILEYKNRVAGKIYSWICLLGMDSNTKKLIRMFGSGVSETLDFEKCYPQLFEVSGSEGIFLRWGWWRRFLML